MDMVIGRVIGIFVLFAPLFAVSQETGAMINGKSYILSRLSMEQRFRRRLCLRVFRAEHALLLKKNASTVNIAHVSMAQIAALINVRADKVCYPTR